MKILIIDDNPATTRAVSKILQLKGHDCSLSNDGKEGLRLISENDYDLVLLDLTMPNFSGVDLLKKIKSFSINFSKIIIFTAMTLSTSQLAELKALGIKRILKKPFSINELDVIISEQNSTMRIKT